MSPVRTLGLLGTLLLALAGGCNTPTIPLPPPEPREFAITITNPTEVVVAGDPIQQRANARFEIFNSTTGRGLIVRAGADGAFTAPAVPATTGDRIELSYQLGAAESDYESGILCVVVPSAPGGELSEANRCQ